MINSKIKWVAREYEISDEYSDESMVMVAETEVTGYIDSELHNYLDKLLENYLNDCRRYNGVSCHYTKRTYFDTGYAYAKVYNPNDVLVAKMEATRVDSVDLEDLYTKEFIDKIMEDPAFE